MYADIEIHPVADSKSVGSGSGSGFGTVFTNHMFRQEYNTELCWHASRIEAVEDIKLHPAASVLHYGQEVFEGLKAYRRPDGNINLFRPLENCRRFNRSAERMMMPIVDEQYHLKALRALVALEADWVPEEPGSSLYLRPTMIATTASLGLGASADYLHFILASPVGAYFPGGFNPVSVLVSERDRRAVQGGVGEAKTGGNYAASLRMSERAAARGYDQVLWLDAIHGRYVEEVGAMNICFVYENRRIVTPKLSGSILPGVTRASVIGLAPTLGFEVVEEELDINEILADIAGGSISEAFGCGTAATIAPIDRFGFRDEDYVINQERAGLVAKTLYEELTGIQYGVRPDNFGWTEVVELPG